MESVIRIATIKDLDKVYDIFQLLVLKGPEIPWTQQKYIYDNLIEDRTYVITIGKEIVGAISLIPRDDAIHVDSISVDNKYQDMGLGKKMLEFARDYGLSVGLKRIRVATYIQYRALPFYIKCGFVLYDQGEDNGRKFYRLERDIVRPID